MEIVEDVNIFPTEVQEAIVSHQDQENQQQEVDQEKSNVINDEEAQKEESSEHSSNSNDNDIHVEDKILFDSVLNKAQDLINQNGSQNLSNNDNLNNINNKSLVKYDAHSKKQPRTCPQTAQKHPILSKKPMIIKKPKTSSSKSSLLATKGKISNLAAEKHISQNFRNNPIIANKYGIYTPCEIVSRPPRVALDSREYNPRLPTELSELAQSILDGNAPDKEASKEELKEAKNQLKSLELELIDKTDYMAAKKAAAAYDYMEKYLSRQQDVTKLKENLEEILSKRNELIAYITSIQESIQAQLEEQKSIANDRLKELEAQQTIEIQEFDENVPTELTREFKHQTKDYLDLRLKQRSLALKREFDEAQKTKEKADKLEEMQKKGDLKSMKKFYSRKRKLILKKHRIQIQCLMDDNFLREKEILNSRQFEIEATNARIAALDEEVKKKCEEKGVKFEELDERAVDQERVERLISRANETRYAKFRPRTNLSGSKYATMRQPLPPLPVEA